MNTLHIRIIIIVNLKVAGIERTIIIRMVSYHNTNNYRRIGIINKHSTTDKKNCSHVSHVYCTWIWRIIKYSHAARSLVVVGRASHTRRHEWLSIRQRGLVQRRIHRGSLLLLVQNARPTGPNALSNNQSSFTLSENELGTCNKKDPQSPICAKITLSSQLHLLPNNTKEAKVAEDALFGKHPRLT
ncbi:hypothetical protein MIMGU_mgv11b019296mg, partial [Erythranthe guttata]